MKPISRQTFAERRKPRRTQRGRFLPKTRTRRGETFHAAPAPTPPGGPSRDFGDVGRARGAGGPQDRATYTCSCGCCFDAPVSTTVSCPHCGAGQAW